MKVSPSTATTPAATSSGSTSAAAATTTTSTYIIIWSPLMTATGRKTGSTRIGIVAVHGVRIVRHTPLRTIAHGHHSGRRSCCCWVIRHAWMLHLRGRLKGCLLIHNWNGGTSSRLRGHHAGTASTNTGRSCGGAGWSSSTTGTTTTTSSSTTTAAGRGCWLPGTGWWLLRRRHDNDDTTNAVSSFVSSLLVCFGCFFLCGACCCCSGQLLSVCPSAPFVDRSASFLSWCTFFFSRALVFLTTATRS